MHKKLTISIDESMYERLIHNVGRGKASQFLESLVQKNLPKDTLADSYKAMASDKNREKEANEWCEGLACRPVLSNTFLGYNLAILNA